MADREKVINELVECIESALSVDSDYVDCVRTGGEVGMTYGEMYKKALETIPQEMVSDFRPANYSSGFKLMCSDYCNSILIWLKNGDEIIYTVKGQKKQEG